MQHAGLLRAVGRRPPRAGARRQAGARMAGRRADERGAEGASAAQPAHARLRDQRAEGARQRQLPPLRRPAPRQRDLERRRRARTQPAPADLVLPGRRLRWLPRLLRRGRREGLCRHAARARPGGQRVWRAGLFDARQAAVRRLRRPAAEHLHRLLRERSGAADVPRARAPDRLRQGRHGVQRILRDRGRAHRRRALAGAARERADARGARAKRRAAPGLPRAHRPLPRRARRALHQSGER